MLALSSNGSSAGSGIVWALVPLTGDANSQRGVRGLLLAFDAQDVSNELWRSEQPNGRNSYGLFAKFAPPTVAGGKVFVATYGNDELQRTYFKNDRPERLPTEYYVAVYGLLTNSKLTVVDQNKDDITVLKAQLHGPPKIDRGKCESVNPHNIDCTVALEQAHGAPSLHEVIVPNNYDFAGCQVMRVTTASKEGGITNADSVGFWSAEATEGFETTNSGRTFPKTSLKRVGNGVLKNGANALFHEFIGMASCELGPTSAFRLFKPFMDFRSDQEQKMYRNWDLAQNYRIGREITQFDRSGELLQ